MIIVDAAHNPHGVDALVEAMGEAFSFSTLVGVVGILEDKDAEGILSGLEQLLDHVVITHVDSARSRDPEELATIAAAIFGEERVSVAPTLAGAIDKATAVAELDDDIGAGVLIVGSVMLVAQARVLLEADRRPGTRRDQ